MTARPSSTNAWGLRQFDFRMQGMKTRKTFTGFLKEKGLYLRLLKYWDLYILILPVVVYFIIFHYAPLYGIQIAFKRFNPALGITGSPWMGFQNFTRFFNSFYFGRLIRNTVTLSLLQLIIGFPFPIILALMISELKNGPFKKGMQLKILYPEITTTWHPDGGGLYVFSINDDGYGITEVKAVGGIKMDTLGVPLDGVYYDLTDSRAIGMFWGLIAEVTEFSVGDDQNGYVLTLNAIGGFELRIYREQQATVEVKGQYKLDQDSAGGGRNAMLILVVDPPVILVSK